MNDIELWNYISERLSDMSTLDKEETLWTLTRIRSYLGGKKAEAILEIGNNEGAFLCMISRLLKKDGLLIGVDSGAWDADVEYELLEEVAPHVNIHLIKGKSEDPKTQTMVSEILGGVSLTVLAIDSLHTEKQTNIEWRMYKHLLGARAVAYFHDIAGGFGQIDNPGRRRTTRDFWNSIKYHHSYEEKRARAHVGPMGVGLLFL